MKKLFIVVLSALALASCANDAVTNIPTSDAIGFNTSVVNGTRITMTNDNLQRFVVSAMHNDLDILMYHTQVHRSVADDGSINWVYDPVRYWPNSGTVDFYAVGLPDYVLDYIDAYSYVDSELSEPGVNTGKRSGYFKMIYLDENNDGLYEGVADFTYATAMGEKKRNTPLPLFFRHAMSQFVFQFKNTNEMLKVFVEDIHIVNMLNGGRYALPIETTSKENSSVRGKWSFDDVFTGKLDMYKIEPVTFDVRINAKHGDWIEVPGDGTIVPYTDVMTWSEFTNEETGRTFYEDSYVNLVPQEVTPWDYENDKTNEKGGSYFLIKVKLMNEDTCLWPRVEDGKTSAKTGAGWVAVPFKFSDTTTTLEEGKRYVITFIFGDGGGIIPPTDETNPGEPILAPIDFTVSVEDFVEVGYDYDLGDLQ